MVPAIYKVKKKPGAFSRSYRDIKHSHKNYKEYRTWLKLFSCNYFLHNEFKGGSHRGNYSRYRLYSDIEKNPGPCVHYTDRSFHNNKFIKTYKQSKQTMSKSVTASDQNVKKTVYTPIDTLKFIKLSQQERFNYHNGKCTKASISLKCKHSYYGFIKQHLLLSGDIESNPGPTYSQEPNYAVLSNLQLLSSISLLRQRLLRYHLQPLDVGGDGDCFFRAISHQLYSNPQHHLNIRCTGVLYLQENPERFIESNTENSWVQYLNNMSLQGTWADHIAIQAVALALNLRIHIIETAQNFNEITIVEGIYGDNRPLLDVYIGHLEELHYVSTLPIATLSSSDQLNNKQVSTCNNSSQGIQIDQKEKRRIYIKEYMRKKRMSANFKEGERESQKTYYKKNKNNLKDLKNQNFKKKRNSPLLSILER